jgi:hypothetical protein
MVASIFLRFAIAQRGACNQEGKCALYHFVPAGAKFLALGVGYTHF